MIKAEDLRIGDLVIVSKTGCKIPKGTVCRVTAIETESMLFDDRSVSVRLIPIDPKCKQISWYDWCKNISPIPLTPEILEKNGFNMREDTVVYAKNRLGLKPLGDGKGYQVGLGSLRFLFVKVRIIKYVHELQNIIWALGEDANLKI